MNQSINLINQSIKGFLHIYETLLLEIDFIESIKGNYYFQDMPNLKINFQYTTM